jgi:hypothetical protein
MSDDLMRGHIVDVGGDDDPLAAELCVSEDDPTKVIVILHSGHDQVRLHGLEAAHAQLIALAVNAPLEN